MKSPIWNTGLVCIIAVMLFSCGKEGLSSSGTILGQAPPDTIPLLFAPNVVSTGHYERDVALSSDGNELYFGFAALQYCTIAVVRKEGNGWSKPEVAPFASDPRYLYFEPCISHDGLKLLFLSTRPPEGQEPKPGWGHQNIWAVDRVPGGEWGEPYDLGSPINTDDGEFFPSLTREGTLYFTRGKGEAEAAVYRSAWMDGRFQAPEKVPLPVASSTLVYNGCVAPDESMLVACVISGDDPRYMVFFRSEEDGWSPGIPLGSSVNVPGTQAISPAFSPDGKYFFFASTQASPGAAGMERLSMDKFHALADSPQNGNSDIYWVSVDLILKLKPAGPGN